MNFISIVVTLICSFLITFLLMPSLIRYFHTKKKGSKFEKKGQSGMLRRLELLQWEDSYLLFLP